MSWILQVATGRRALGAAATALGGAGLLFGTGPFPAVRSLAPAGVLPEEQIGYGADELHAFLGAIGPEGRAAYVMFQRLDILTPLLLGGAVMLLIAWLLRRGGATAGPVAWLPFAPVLFLLTEVAEDYVLARAARLYPAESSISATLPVLTGAKFGVMTLMAVVIAGCALRLAWRKD